MFWLANLYRKIKCKIFRKIIKQKNISDQNFLIKYGKKALGYKMNLLSPTTFNEKINWYKLNYRNDLMVKCVDKYDVRDYVTKKGLGAILVKNFGVYNDLDEININELPDKFVAKLTGDSGGVVVCYNKIKFFSDAQKKFKNISVDYSNFNKEWPYHLIKNRIIVEELIETKDGGAPKDYKFFCFNGEPRFLFVASEREKNVKFDFFDLDWNHIKVKQGHQNSEKNIPKPDKLSEMIEICRILSEDFPHVRVDLYYENDKIFFGELTFFHFSGLVPFYPFKYDIEFGRYFEIDKKEI